jgi:addiction module RelE/StbE family toxin
MTKDSIQRHGVIWSARAINDLETVRAYIGTAAPLDAQRLVVRLVNAAESLADMPERGRRVGQGVRELAVIYPYLIRYRVIDGGVEIVRVRHGARRPTG